MWPRVPLKRPLSGWAGHAGVWLLLQSALTLVLGRPWFAMAAALALLLTVVLVNNAKMRALNEPFVLQDYEYFTDAARYPRLYIPFLGWGKFLLAAAGFVAAAGIGLYLENVPVARWSLQGQAGGLLTVMALAAVLLAWASVKRPSVGVDALRDLHQWGLLTSLWHYARRGLQLPEQTGPYAACAPAYARPHSLADGRCLPDLVVVQSESFFDARTLFEGVCPQVLAELDALRSQAFLCGEMQVPAWGANTVRTEFAFLTGMEGQQLGVHQFNPYRAIAKGWQPGSVALYLKSLGYRTVCVHPYLAGFYLRNRVYPMLGFDDFIDIAAFEGAECCGAYVGDAAVAEKIVQLLRSTEDDERPLFVMAITMENHGPLHLEHVQDIDVPQLYRTVPPPGCDDLTIYLRHLRNANRMIGRLRGALEQWHRPASLCWYGDHVPIMPDVYKAFGMPSGTVPYACWANASFQAQMPGVVLRASNCPPMKAHQLSRQWLQGMGLVAAGTKPVGLHSASDGTRS